MGSEFTFEQFTRPVQATFALLLLPRRYLVRDCCSQSKRNVISFRGSGNRARVNWLFAPATGLASFLKLGLAAWGRELF